MDSIEYRQVDQQASAGNEIAMLLDRITDWSGFEHVLVNVKLRAMALSYERGDDADIIMDAVAGCIDEIRDQLDGEPESAAEALSERAHNCVRKEWR